MSMMFKTSFSLLVFDVWFFVFLPPESHTTLVNTTISTPRRFPGQSSGNYSISPILLTTSGSTTKHTSLSQQRHENVRDLSL